MERAEMIKVANEMGFENWLDEGTFNSGWYTCVLTEQKFRGKKVIKEMLDAQAMAMAKYYADQEADKEEEAMSDNTPALGEGQEKAVDEAVRNTAKPSDMQWNGEGQIVQEINFAGKQHDDTLGVVHQEMGNNLEKITKKLMNHLEELVVEGKSTKLVAINCVDCGAERLIKPQDRFQVKRCEGCQKKHRNRMRAERRREKRQAEKQAEKNS